MSLRKLVEKKSVNEGNKITVELDIAGINKDELGDYDLIVALLDKAVEVGKNTEPKLQKALKKALDAAVHSDG